MICRSTSSSRLVPFEGRLRLIETGLRRIASIEEDPLPLAIARVRIRALPACPAAERLPGWRSAPVSVRVAQVLELRLACPAASPSLLDLRDLGGGLERKEHLTLGDLIARFDRHRAMRPLSSGAIRT